MIRTKKEAMHYEPSFSAAVHKCTRYHCEECMILHNGRLSLQTRGEGGGNDADYNSHVMQNKNKNIRVLPAGARDKTTRRFTSNLSCLLHSLEPTYDKDKDKRQRQKTKTKTTTKTTTTTTTTTATKTKAKWCGRMRAMDHSLWVSVSLRPSSSFFVHSLPPLPPPKKNV
jgi:hypothetical protein